MCRISTVIKAVLLLCAFFCLAAAQGGKEKVQSQSQPVVVTGQTSSTGVASVRIGNLTWTKQNLNIKTADSWCYDNNESNCAKYGRLYTWEAAKTACRSMGGGWRLPTRGDWDNLGGAVGGSREVDKDGTVDYYGAGKKLKSRSGWNQNGNGTDDFGFSALPGGYRDSGGSFFDGVGGYGYWWSAAESGGGKAYFRGMGYDYDDVSEGSDDVRDGHSARCVED